ncbi:MAG: CidA/LrgA family protein [Acholeplasma sp.]|nr:CidA/LrgA family protein [Acholeplasma sp.]
MKILKEFLIILIFTFFGELIAWLLPFSFPGSVIGLLLFFVSLLTKIIKVEQVKELSNWLQKNMAILFVPLCVGVMQYFDIIKVQWLEIIIILFFSTALTMLVVSLVAKRGVKNE